MNAVSGHLKNLAWFEYLSLQITVPLAGTRP